jgi:hypothetical protein
MNQEMEQWKADRYSFIVRESLNWQILSDPKIVSRLNTRHLSGQEREWMDELAKETNLVAFSGHGPDGPVSGYRMSDFAEKAMEAYVLRKEMKRLKAELDDCQAEVIQEKEYVKVLTEIVYRTGAQMKEAQMKEAQIKDLDDFKDPMG